MSVFTEWTCVFPGKMGLSWKHAYPYESYATKEEAEAAAAKNCNVVAVPVQLFERMKEHEHRMVAAERILPELLAKCRGMEFWMASVLGSRLKHQGYACPSGHPHGGAVAEIAEWELRRHLDELRELTAKATEEPMT